jgi:hypothetical protein
VKLFSTNPNHFHFSHKELKWITLLFFTLFIFLFFKAILMGVYHDELLTFYFYTNTGVIFPPEAHLDANNHFLNSILSRWSFLLFGSSPLAIRLPNVLAFPFYFFAVIQLAARFKDQFIRWTFALSFLMCSFTFEYFAMCRGYGLSLMFLVLAIHHVIRLTETNHLKYIIFTAVFLWFGIAANMTILPYALLTFIFMLLFVVFQDFKTNKKGFFLKIGIMALLGAAFLIHAKWSFQMKEAGILIHGDLDGFYDVTIRTVSEHLFGFSHPILGYSFIVLFFATCLYLPLKFIKSKSCLHLFSIGGYFVFLLVFSVLLLFLMAEFLGINYPRDRTGMHLLLLLFGAIIALSVELQKRHKAFRYLAAILLFFPLQFIYHYHPAESHNFDAGRHSDELYTTIKEINHDFKFPLTVSARGFQQLPWYYSNYRSNADQGSSFYVDFPIMEADIIIKSDEDPVSENDLIYTYYDSIYQDPFTHVTCFKRKQFLERKLIERFDLSDVQKSTAEYHNFLLMDADSLIGKSVYIGVELTLSALQKPFRSRLVIAVDQENEPRNLYYDFVELDWLKSAYNGESNNVVQGAIIHNVPADAETVAFYLWNPDMTEFSIQNGKCFLYEIERDF